MLVNTHWISEGCRPIEIATHISADAAALLRVC